MIMAFREHFQDQDDKEKADSEAETSGSEVHSDTDTFQEDHDNFTTQEIEHEVAFTGFIKRISCFSHTLQLIVHKFNKVESFKKVLANVHALVKKVNKSSKATERLTVLCNKKLVSDCPTRWSSTFLMIGRLLEVKDHLSTVLE